MSDTMTLANILPEEDHTILFSGSKALGDGDMLSNDLTGIAAKLGVA